MVMLGVSGGSARSQATSKTGNDTQASIHLPVAKRQLNDWQKAIEKALFIPDPLPALSTKTYGTFSPASGVIAERVTYGTLYGMRVPAIVYRSATPLKLMPAMVVVNGHQGDKTSWYAFYSGILYARAGAVVLTYDPIGEDERNSSRKSETSAHDTVVPGVQMPARMGGQMITDILQAVSYLRSRKDAIQGASQSSPIPWGRFTLQSPAPSIRAFTLSSFPAAET